MNVDAQNFRGGNEVMAYTSDKVLVAHYKTKGGATHYKAWAYTWDGKPAYDYLEEDRHGRSHMQGGGCMTETEFCLNAARHLYFAKQAGVKFIPVIAHTGIDNLLNTVK